MALGRLWMATALVVALAQGNPQDKQDPHAHHHHAPATAPGGWVRYQHRSAGFSLEHPSDWTVVSDKAAVATHIAHPTKAVHLFASAFTMTEGTLKDFADAKFGVQPELFKPLGAARSVEGVGWSGLQQEAEAHEGVEHARRRILCAQHGSLYVSLALYVDPKELSGAENLYERIFSSLRFGEAAAPPASPSPPLTRPR
jgi:hypothetical protein